jgi:hypothetical protein
MRNQLLASVSSRFAHLAGIGKKRAAAEEDDKDKKEDATEDKDDERMESDEKEDAKKKSKAKDGDDDSEDEDEDEDDGDEEEGDDDEKKGKAGSGDDGEEKQAKAVRRGRRMERSRWTNVLSSKSAARNIEMAVMLLSDTSKSAEHIIGRLSASTSAGSSGGRRNPQIETSAPAAGGNTSANIAASWETAIKRAAGGRR